MFFNNQILVIERDPHTLRIIKNALLQNEFIVHFASNCELAMQIAIKNKPDLILCEVALEDMDGREFMRMVHKTPEIQDTPFIFLTSRTLIKDKISALEAGADDYITKPFNETELVARIKSVIRRVGRNKISSLVKDDGIKGNLQDINLLDLIQLFDMGRKTAVIQVEGDEKKGRVYFETGEVVHAVCDNLFGKEALFEILSIGKGTFLIHLHINSKIRTIDGSPTNLIIEAMNRFDEERISPPGSWHNSETEASPTNSLYKEGIKELFEKGVIEEHQEP
jgi:CRP/FNR family cyclic AMP-dependent transcriptional regulator